MHNIKNFDFVPFYRRMVLSGHNHLFVRPGITLTFFLDEPLSVSCEAVANLMDLFFSAIPLVTFRSYLAKNGYYKSLTTRQVAKDLRTMRNLPPDYEGYTLNYSEGELGEVGTHAIVFMATEPTTNAPDRSNLVRLEFPEDIIESWGEVRFLEFVTDAAQTVPFYSGHAGLAFKRSVMESESIQAIAPLLTRYLGFDPSEQWIRRWMRGHAYTSHWINLLGTQLLEKLGGLKAIEATVGAEIKPLRNGVWIRGARLPPVGDVNRGANDIGELPNVARLLRPMRPLNLKFAHTDFDALAWLGRFDDLPPQQWDNS